MSRPGERNLWKGPALWWALFAVTWVLSSYSRDLSKALEARWIVKYPAGWRLPLKRDISDAMKWLVEDASFGLFSFKDFTRGIAWVIEVPYDFVRAAVIDGFVVGVGSEASQIAPSLSWIAVIAVVVAIGHTAKSWSLAALVGGCFLYLAIFGQWDSAMVTLASVLISVPIGVAGGLLLGIGAYRWPAFDKILRPILDLMQTVPVFAYLVPILFLFGFGPVAALVATIIYAMPPMVRVTTLALRGVPTEIREFGTMVGCTRRQMMWKVLVPSAAPGLMVGVNQVIMLSLNMVIIASMIGAGGLGFEVLSSLRRLDIGAGLEAGIAIVVMAIALDRLSQAFAARPAKVHSEDAGGESLVKRHPWTSSVLAVAVVTGLAGLVLPAFQSYPASLTLTTGPFWADLVEFINVNFFDQFEAVKTFMLTWLLLPVKRFLLGIPWPWGIAIVTLAGWKFGGWRLALLAGGLALFIAANGLWAKAMITLYLCGVSVLLASIIGIPLGVLAAENARANKVISAVIDTLQTLPSFVYLIPVVMLFRVGDFSAMIAVVLYALAPAVRYAAHGIRSIEPQLIEAGIVAGCTRWQLLRKIKLPLALPEILLGLNQTIMLALSMLVITALVGTRDLGQEVYIALTKADSGRGIIAGLSVAAIAIIVDRILAASARNARARLGLEA
ncbi:proline/glycine betaine ABC transporter permease [Pelagibius sp. Alg239-R121]|uniref:ABC transporter permease n=1 Tax=Pelagibius sp. Alg239-R121 TaxID=2993448 RepID=UPI0024A6AF89|nr:ABC transporter permease subunit [Pelagibius sp. Alg239-R121]